MAERIDNYLDKEIPDYILEQLKVEGRIKQVLKPTRTSTVSISGAEEDRVPTGEEAAQDKIDELIDHVAEMEDLVEQLEDMVDDHLKDMSIPPANDRVSDAAKRLNPDGDGNINKDTLDQADLINDMAPILLTGQDPIESALTGEGIVDPNSGDFLNCNELTKDFVKQLKFLKNPTSDSPDYSIEDQGQKHAKAHEDSVNRMMLDIIAQMWWNIIWSRFLVDHGIINPTRMLIADPFDRLVMFFKRACNTRPFKNKSTNCIRREGPLNRILNRVRQVLICFVPKKFYKRYQNQSDLVCPSNEEVCASRNEGSSMGEKEEELYKMKNAMEKLELLDCVDSNDFIGDAKKLDINGPGLPPECYKNSGIILQAILDDALSPSSNINNVIAEAATEV